MRRKHELTTRVKIDEYGQRTRDLSQRLIKVPFFVCLSLCLCPLQARLTCAGQVMRKLERFEGHNVPSQPAELEFRQRLDELQRSLNKPNQYKGTCCHAPSFLSLVYLLSFYSSLRVLTGVVRPCG
jgi:hypothetical protein